jgi:SWI/SNF-related matrix-associated actin-dependent regulator 1 of chromatin subfamily A
VTTRGFDANVPARKPRPISRVLTELTAGSENGEPPVAIAQTAEDPSLRSGQALAPRAGARVARDDSPRVAQTKSGRERTASLRERLAATARGAKGEAEPQQTAAAVRELIELLRAKLETAIEERSRLAGELEEARAGLGRSEAELKKERRARASLEAQAEERRRIAEEAVAEAEALAAERDQVLEEIAGLRGLEDQAALLHEAEVELADLDTRLQEAQSGRARAEARCRELTAEVERLSQAGAALEALETLVRPGPAR